MKKLMTMLSAVAVAFGLQAASPYPSGSHFNDENWLEIKSETNLWTSLEGLSISTNSASLPAGVGFPAQFDETAPGNNLEFQRGLTDPTYRAIQVDETNQPIKQDLTDAGVVVDTLIKFTPYDEEDQASLDGTGAKIAVWVKEIEGADGAASTYQLMVSAGKYDSDATISTRTDYACSSKINDINAWYRLTVKAVADMSAGANIPGFVVFVNGEVVSSAEVKKDVSNIGELSSEATSWNVEGKIFPSLINSDKTIRQVGFAGRGWIDDLSFTDGIPTFVAATETFTIVGGAHVESFKYNGQTWTRGEAPLVCLSTGDAPETVTDIVYAAGYFGSPTETVERTANFANTIGADAQLLVATVTIGEQITPCGTLAAAIEAVNAATADVTVTLKLVVDATADIVVNNANDVHIILDLAGRTLTATSVSEEAEVYVINLKQGGLVVTDTSSTQTGRVVGIVTSEGGDITLAAGIYDGLVYLSGNSQKITGGKFNSEYNTIPDLEGYLESGKRLVKEGDYYVLGDKPAGVTPDGEAVVVDTEEDAAKLVISATSPNTSIVSDEAYAAYFTKKSTVTADGKCSVMAVLDTTVVKADEVAAELVGKFDQITSDGVTISKAKPGLYYSVEQGQSLDAMTEGDRVQATAETVTIKATKFTGSGFYKVLVNTKPKTAK